MSYYPILVDLKEKKVIVVGGGTVAQRKVETLLEYDAVVHLMSRELTPALQRYVEEGMIKFLGKEFSGDVLDGAFLVIAATDDPEVNRRVSEFAKEKGLLVNAVDQPSDCSFIVPAIVKRGDLLVAVSTSGKSPALARRIRENLDTQFGSEYEEFLRLMGRVRKEVLSRGLSQEEKSRVFHELVDSDILESITRKDFNGIASELNRIIQLRLSSDDVINYLKAE
ncbi:MAG: bifunctional precorrin-2 dehydrogenase/sirohydrochlorin ferrochelatase [Deltaproteobacteria bacterium]|nr:bifunctional precorrin-2 dehydrogenase/sirohydrochlorin ferrochelatase [Deltaproteobacteria bacterium]